jgi:hypothetical protein
MVLIRLSRGLCGLVAFGTLLGAPAFANIDRADLVPWFCATMISSSVGFMLFDWELRRARREMDSGE